MAENREKPPAAMMPNPFKRNPSPHDYYIYHDGPVVYARIRGQKPIAAERFASAQEAHDRVQAIINPDKKRHDEYGNLGFLSPEFQKMISPRCERYVKDAYKAAGVKL